MTAMRDLYLHIGLHKTGTSYLQKLFLENRTALIEAGIGLGPHQDPLTGNHHPIIAAIARDGADAVFDEAASCPGERLLISAEELCIELQDPQKSRALLAAAARHFNLRLVIFLRRQDYLKESVYAQIVKHWYAGGILGDDHYDYDHDARLRALEAVFGQENIVVRLYPDAGPRDIVGSFLEAIGGGVDPARLRPVDPQNVSMHRRKLLFMAGVPKNPRAEEGPQHMFLARFMTRVVDRSGAIADDGGRHMMSPAERHALVARHQEGNRAIVARYRLAEPGSFVELPDPAAPWSPPAPISAAEARAVFRAALAEAWVGRNPAAALKLSARLGALFAGTARNLRGREGTAAVPAALATAG
jgi:hypothetical protein